MGEEEGRGDQLQIEYVWALIVFNEDEDDIIAFRLLYTTSVG